MKPTASLSFTTAVLALAFALPAQAADAPAKADASDAKPAASAKAASAKKRTVTPHNHLRDSKGVWVPEKKNPKLDRVDGEGKASAAGQAQK